jgi:hypothetical protein
MLSSPALRAPATCTRKLLHQKFVLNSLFPKKIERSWFHAKINFQMLSGHLTMTWITVMWITVTVTVTDNLFKHELQKSPRPSPFVPRLLRRPDSKLEPPYMKCCLSPAPRSTSWSQAESQIWFPNSHSNVSIHTVTVTVTGNLLHTKVLTPVSRQPELSQPVQFFRPPGLIKDWLIEAILMGLTVGERASDRHAWFEPKNPKWKPISHVHDLYEKVYMRVSFRFLVVSCTKNRWQAVFDPSGSSTQNTNRAYAHAHAI